VRIKKNKKTKGVKKGYTIIELLVVLAVIVLIFSIGLGSLLTSQRQVLFLSSYESVVQIVRDARSLALAGKAMPDYADFNANSNTSELVAPANYGVSFNLTAGTVTTFVDLRKNPSAAVPAEGQYDPPPAVTGFYQYVAGKDVKMATYTLDSTMFKLVSNMFNRLVPPNDKRVDIFFSPIFGDFSIYPPLVNAAPSYQQTFLIFGVTDISGLRKKCSKIHPVAGVPEVATDAECVTP